MTKRKPKPGPSLAELRAVYAAAVRLANAADSDPANAIGRGGVEWLSAEYDLRRLVRAAERKGRKR
mgnify:FL=1